MLLLLVPPTDTPHSHSSSYWPQSSFSHSSHSSHSHSSHSSYSFSSHSSSCSSSSFYSSHSSAGSWAHLTLSQASQCLLQAAAGDEGGGIDAAVKDLDRYISLCETLNAHKFELPLQVCGGGGAAAAAVCSCCWGW